MLPFHFQPPDVSKTEEDINHQLTFHKSALIDEDWSKILHILKRILLTPSHLQYQQV